VPLTPTPVDAEVLGQEGADHEADAEFDLVATIFGLSFAQTNAATRIVYGLVGVGAVILAARLASVRAESSPDLGSVTGRA
jgi:Domain of unknown function (DUF378)